MNLNDEYTQSENSTLELSIGSKDDILKINGNATFKGKLKLDFIDNYIPDNNMTIITFNSNSQSSKFSSIETTGLSADYKISVAYDNNAIRLLIEKANTNTTSSGSTSHHHSSNSSSNSTETNDSTVNNDSEKVNEVKNGWQQKNGVWYNISKEGITNTGWLKDETGKWYYLDKSGVMQTGWFKNSDEKWYYLNESGAMQTSWFKNTDGKWYYLNESGAMEHDKYIDGYYLDSNGAWAN